LGYKFTKADLDVWIQSAVNSNGYQYYEMLLGYADDVVCVSHNPARTLDQIREPLKDELVGSPKGYLRANISQFQLPNDSSMA